jgi:hypothetical protein
VCASGPLPWSAQRLTVETAVGAPEHSTELLQIVLAEFQALRKEIADRSAAGWTLLNLNMTVTAAVAGFVLSNKANPLLLLLVPILSPALGMLFVDHAYNIDNLGTYIKNTLAPLVNKIAATSGLLGYEQRIDQWEQRKLYRFLPLGLPLFLVFSVAPIGALVFSFRSIEEVWTWVLWGLGAVLTAIYLVFWTSFLLLPYRKRAGGHRPVTT